MSDIITAYNNIRVYTRQYWSDEWVANDDIEPLNARYVACGSDSTAQFRIRCGMVMQTRIDVDARRVYPVSMDWHYILVREEDIDGAKRTLWAGVIIHDHRDPLGGITGDQVLTAWSFARCLDQVRIGSTIAHADNDDGYVVIGTAINFNERGIGNRHGPVEPETDYHLFGGNDFWSHADVMRYMVGALINSSGAPLPYFQIDFPDSSLSIDPLSQQFSEVDVSGLSVLQVIDHLVDRDIGLMWTTEYTPLDEYPIDPPEVDAVHIVIRSTFTEPVFVETGMQFPANTDKHDIDTDIMPDVSVSISGNAGARYGRVVARGNKVVCAMTAYFADSDQIVPAWSAEEATAYGLATDEERKLDSLRNVFRRFRLADTFDAGPYTPVRDESGTPSLEFGVESWPRSRKILAWVPNDDRHTSSPFVCLPKSVGDSVDHRIDSLPDDGNSAHVSIDSGQIAINPQFGHLFGKNHFTAESQNQALYDYLDLWATFAIELDEHAVGICGEYDGPFSTLVIDVPDADLWIRHESCRMNESASVDAKILVDDTLRLRIIASIAHAWYSIPRCEIDLNYKYLTNVIKVGHIVGSVSPVFDISDANTVVTSVSYDFEKHSTTIRTSFMEPDFRRMVHFPHMSDARSVAKAIRKIQTRLDELTRVTNSMPVRIAKPGGGAGATPAKFRLEIQELACPKVEIEGVLTDVPPDSGVDDVDSLCVGGDGRWIRITAVDSADQRRADYVPSFSLAFGLEGTTITETIAFDPVGTGCAVHALQTTWGAWQTTLAVWVTAYAAWLATGRNQDPPEIEPALPTLDADLMAMTQARTDPPLVADLIAAHNAWGDAVRVSAYMDIYNAWRIDTYSAFRAAWSSWKTLWEAWYIDPIGDEPTPPEYPEQYPEYNTETEESEVESVVTFRDDVADFETAFSDFETAMTEWDHESDPPSPPVAVEEPTITIPAKADIEPDPDLDHTGDGTWLMGQWLGIVELSGPTTSGSGGAFTVTAADCETSTVLDPSKGYGWKLAEWTLCNSCCGEAGWYCVNTGGGNYEPQYFECGPKSFAGGPYATEADCIAAGCACYGTVDAKSLHIRIPSFTFEYEIEYGGVSSGPRKCVCDIDIDGLFYTEYTGYYPYDHRILTWNALEYLTYYGPYETEPNINVSFEKYDKGGRSCTSVGAAFGDYYMHNTAAYNPANQFDIYLSLGDAGSPSDVIGSQLHLYIKDILPGENFDSNAVYIGMNGEETLIAGASVTVADLDCPTLSGDYVWSASFDCSTGWTVSLVSHDPEAEVPEDTGWVSDGAGGYTRTNGSACTPDDPTETPTCYYYWSASGYCDSEGNTVWNVSPYYDWYDTTGPASDWVIYQDWDPCSGYASCVTTSSTPPGAPATGLDCSGCEY